MFGPIFENILVFLKMDLLPKEQVLNRLLLLGLLSEGRFFMVFIFQIFANFLEIR